MRFPAQSWALAVMISLGVISLALICVVTYVCKKLKATESERAESLVYKA